MTSLGISLGWSAREELDRIVDLVAAAELGGVEACWVIDSQLAMRDAFTLLAVLARETPSIMLGPGVTNLLTRHETVIAATLGSLAAIAPGRIIAGIGAGDSAVFPIGLKPQRVAELDRGVTRLTALLGGEPVEIGDASISIRAVGEPPPPIFLAASQPRMLRLAGAVADGVIVMGPSHPDVYRAQRDIVRRGAEEAGRDPDSIQLDLWVTMAVGDRASDAVRSWASAQARWLARWESVPPALERFRDEMEAAAASYDFSQHLSVSADHADSVSDEFVGALAITGDIEACRGRLDELSAVGADRITVSLMSGGRQRRLHDLLEVWNGRGG